MKKYIVYQNDLKHKNRRNLNESQIIWNDDDVYKLYREVNCDTLKYRLEECEKNNFTILDLSGMELPCIPNLPQHIKKNIKYFFANENNLSSVSFDDYEKIEVIDLSNNNLETIHVPNSIVELNCKNNKLTSLPDKNILTNIQRIDCSNNSIENIPDYDSIKKIICSHNKISIIGGCVAEHIACDNNNIVDISDNKNLKYLDCSNNRLTSLKSYHNLTDLICNDNNISQLNEFKNIKYLELIRTKIENIPYFKTLQELLSDTVKNISKQYIEKRNIKKYLHRGKILHINFEPKSYKKL